MIAPGWGMFDATVDWPNILYISVVSIKSQERRFMLSLKNSGPGKESEAQYSLFCTFRDSFNVAMQGTCPEFPLHLIRIQKEWLA